MTTRILPDTDTAELVGSPAANPSSLVRIRPELQVQIQPGDVDHPAARGYPPGFAGLAPDRPECQGAGRQRNGLRCALAVIL
ncbi:MAG: hypothetical protein CMJ95_07520 [Planctomycetes bacterium]|nr:hypothetical protein [Planctomycetota bacterium]